MKRIHWITLVVCLGLAASAAAGDVWINCEAGLEIYLDGDLAGISIEAEDGKHLRELSDGDHTIRIERNGVAFAEFPVTVGYSANQIVVGEHATGDTDEVSDAPEGEAAIQLVGRIEITSDPREINVKFENQRIPKKHPILTLASVPVGEHKMWFESSGTVLKETVRVQAAQPVKVMVDFRNQRVVITGDTSQVQGGDPPVEEGGPRAEPECIEYWIEVLRTTVFEEIEPYQQSLKELGFPRERHKVITIEDPGVAPIYKLRVGPIERMKKAKWAAGLIRNAGLSTVWVLPEECQTHAEKRRHELRPDR
jgi:hypothetical protein